MAVLAQRLLVFLGFTPPMLNPILCTLAKKDFRRALKEVVLVDSKEHCERPVYLNALALKTKLSPTIFKRGNILSLHN